MQTGGCINLWNKIRIDGTAGSARGKLCTPSTPTHQLDYFSKITGNGSTGCTMAAPPPVAPQSGISRNNCRSSGHHTRNCVSNNNESSYAAVSNNNECTLPHKTTYASVSDNYECPLPHQTIL